MPSTTGERIQQKLFPGEQLIWSGRPLPCRLDWSSPFSLLTVVFLLGFMGITGVHSLRRIGDAGWASSALITLVTPLGIGVMLRAIMLQPRGRSATVYGVTDGRVVIVSGWLGRRTKSFALGDMSEANLVLTEHRDRSGTIRFADFR